MSASRDLFRPIRCVSAKIWARIGENIQKCVGVERISLGDLAGKRDLVFFLKKNVYNCYDGKQKVP